MVVHGSLIKLVHDGQISSDYRIYRFQPPKHTQTHQIFSFLVSRPAAGISQGAGKRQKEVGDPRGAPWALTTTEPQKWVFFGIQLNSFQSHALQSSSRFSARRES
jgi:hypothetical protein